jgi:hypothetical protein
MACHLANFSASQVQVRMLFIKVLYLKIFICYYDLNLCWPVSIRKYVIFQTCCLIYVPGCRYCISDYWEKVP